MKRRQTNFCLLIFLLDFLCNDAEQGDGVLHLDLGIEVVHEVIDNDVDRLLRLQERSKIIGHRFVRQLFLDRVTLSLDAVVDEVQQLQGDQF